MKIVSIDIYEVFGPQMAKTRWKPVLIKVNTDEGICGFGEVGLAYGAGSAAGAGMVKELARYVIGMNPMNVEEIWEKLFRKTFWGMGGGTVVFGGMSAIDMACWDIRGKALGVPVYELLGGKMRSKLRSYASQIQFDWGKDNNRSLTKPEEYAEAARHAVADGYDAVKVDVACLNAAGQYAPIASKASNSGTACWSCSTSSTMRRTRLAATITITAQVRGSRMRFRFSIMSGGSSVWYEQPSQRARRATGRSGELGAGLVGDDRHEFLIRSASSARATRVASGVRTTTSPVTPRSPITLSGSAFTTTFPVDPTDTLRPETALPTASRPRISARLAYPPTSRHWTGSATAATWALPWPAETGSITP